jgi:hypothetical protein
MLGDSQCAGIKSLDACSAAAALVVDGRIHVDRFTTENAQKRPSTSRKENANPAMMIKNLAILTRLPTLGTSRQRWLADRISR